MFDLGEEKGTYFITMEYVSGEDLESFIKRAAPLGKSRTMALGKQVCEGPAEAHRLGVVRFATDVKVIDVDSKRLLKSSSSNGEGIGSILKTQIDELARKISGDIGGTGQKKALHRSQIRRDDRAKSREEVRDFSRNFGEVPKRENGLYSLGPSLTSKRKL